MTLRWCLLLTVGSMFELFCPLATHSRFPSWYSLATMGMDVLVSPSKLYSPNILSRFPSLGKGLTLEGIFHQHFYILMQRFDIMWG